MKKISEENLKIIKILTDTGYCNGIWEPCLQKETNDEFDNVNGGIYLAMPDNLIEYLMPFNVLTEYPCDEIRVLRQLNILIEFFKISDVFLDTPKERLLIVKRVKNSLQKLDDDNE